MHMFTTAVSYAKKSPDRLFLEGGVYPGHNVFNNSIKKGFSMMCQGIPHTTKVLTHVQVISLIFS